MKTPARVAVFASGGGTNLQSLLDHFNGTRSPEARVELVVADRPETGAERRAHHAGVPARVLPAGPATATPLLELLEQHRIDLIVLAGYLKLVPIEVVAHYDRRMLNIHPALLPAFGGSGMYGMKVHQAVLESGATVSGATVHFVAERYDQGAIIAQWPVPVVPGDTPERLAARVLRVEHVLLPAALSAVLEGQAAPRMPDDLIFDIKQNSAPAASVVRALIR